MSPPSRAPLHVPRARRYHLDRVLLSALILAGALAAADEDDEGAGGSPPIELRDGRPVVRLDAGPQALSGIEVRALQPRALRPERRASARVVDLEPLLRLRGRHAEARTETRVAAAALDTARERLERLVLLEREAANVSERQLFEARAVVRERAARREAVEARARSLRETLLQQWGPVLAEMALSDAPAFERFLRLEEVLLLVVLPPGESLPAAGETIYVDPRGTRGRAREARRLAPAPATDPLVQGETWYFRAPAEGLRVGMRLVAWIPAGEGTRRGVMVPAGAVVWTGGRPWVFEEIEPGLFARRALVDYERTADGWFVEGLGDAAHRIVVTGGQVLLSQEFRWNIPDEDEID